ncbi:hypothetical protein L210DRAFT_976407 [Boletus edulis BED1]|uniref:AAA+ ATPase domain-containing protein n=1 Tax=Boletus edulis BED1 TaxID=1328754 RepID=A0AAD4C6J7_BOLED|nr:hypothetical protein L210DRAFT_976407 [Boletus edulis BED1]
MSEKRRARITGGQAKAQRPPTQTTLKDLFQRPNLGTAPVGKEQDVHSEQHTDPVAPSLQAVDPHPPAKPCRPKPSLLFPIFTMKERPRDAVINVDDTEVIDITDASSDTELSTEPPLSSTHHLSPRSEAGQETSPLLPPSPIHFNVHGSDTSIPHAGTHEHACPHKASKNKRTLGLGNAAPFPSSCSQHVRGVQHSYASSQAPLKCRVFPSLGLSDEGTLDFLTERDDTPSISLDRTQKFLTPQQCEEYHQSLGRDYIEPHPAFARISVHRQRIPLHDGEMWTRRFRPRRANEVLGNERHALYLRDWLHALELRTRGREPEKPAPKGATARENKEKGNSKRLTARGVKRPRVVRAVTRKQGNKKRRVDDLDDFVVFSDVEEELADDPCEDSEDELAFCQRTLSRLHRRDTTDTPVPSNGSDTGFDHTPSQSQEPVRTNFTSNLTNTLLITGPPGCGKTAAVYACAEELGWEVFEVYPGIGRRNGASLDQLVGDVGRNHIVQTVHRPKASLETKEGKGLRDYLARSKTGKFAGFGGSQEAGTEGQPISVEGERPKHELKPMPREREMEEAGISGKCHAESDGSGPNVGQSLVLLEEVDVLFKEDAGFWPAVVEFIRCCQRPVVMTCNDPGLVPVGDLPLQDMLVFEPCPSTVAATFLQCVSLAEGCLIPHEDLMVLYESRDAMYGIDIPDRGKYPGTERVPLPDLRRSITQLQMLCVGARHGSGSEMHQGEEAEGHVRGSGGPISVESRATVEREWWRKMNRHSELMSHVDAELCRTTPDTTEVVVEDEEVGYVVLDGREGEVFWERDELIAAEAIRHSRGVHAECGTGPIEASINPARRLEFRARVEYQARMVKALQDVLGRAAVLMPQRSMFLDYIPWVRHMVRVDDELERRAEYSGRRTRNSMRTVHARSVAVGDWQREEMRW